MPIDLEYVEPPLHERQRLMPTEESSGRATRELHHLAAALVKAQTEMTPASRAAENPFFHSKYADLQAVWNACRMALGKHGLAIVQTTATSEPGTVTVYTRLLHTSGQWIEGALTLRPTKTDPQSAGSAITYARRYALAAICGVVVEGDDDDAQQASRPAAPHRPPRDQHSSGEAITYARRYEEAPVAPAPPAVAMPATTAPTAQSPMLKRAWAMIGELKLPVQKREDGTYVTFRGKSYRPSRFSDEQLTRFVGDLKDDIDAVPPGDDDVPF